MKNNCFGNSFKESYLNHLKTPKSERGETQRRNKTSLKMIPKIAKPKYLPPISRSKSPQHLPLKNFELQEKYEKILKLFSSPRREKHKKKPKT